MTADTYNGWKNHTTWAMSLWLANEEPLYRIARNVVQGASRDRGKALERWVRSRWACLPTVMRMDVGADLSGIDWQAVADSIGEE